MNGYLSDEKQLVYGVPQGEILSVTLFLLAMNKISKYLPQQVKMCLFADDLVIYSQDKNVHRIKVLLRQCLEGLDKWSNDTGFQFAVEKTKAMHFTKCQYNKFNPALKMEEMRIKYVKETKFLGMVIDDKMTWR